MTFARDDQGFARDLIHDPDFHAKLRAVAITKGAREEADAFVGETQVAMLEHPEWHAGRVVMHMRSLIRNARRRQTTARRNGIPQATLIAGDRPRDDIG